MNIFIDDDFCLLHMERLRISEDDEQFVSCSYDRDLRATFPKSYHDIAELIAWIVTDQWYVWCG